MIFKVAIRTIDLLKKWCFAQKSKNNIHNKHQTNKYEKLTY